MRRCFGLLGLFFFLATGCATTKGDTKGAAHMEKPARLGGAGEEQALSFEGEADLRVRGPSPETVILPSYAKPSPVIQALAEEITRSSRTDRQKAEAIFLWLAKNIAYDAEGYFKGDYGDLSPEGVVRRRVAVCSGYAGLFTALSRAAGLKAVTILGTAKGINFIPGQVNGINHAWNAVWLERRWHLLDSTWAAGSLNGRIFVRRYEPHYFLTPPEQMINSHFPQDPRWQLLKKPHSLPSFLASARLSPRFFRFGWKLASPLPALARVGSSTRLEFQIPSGFKTLSTLEWFGENLFPSPGLYIPQGGGAAWAELRFPYPGRYTFRLFGNTKDKSLLHQVLSVNFEATGSGAPPARPPVFFSDYAPNKAELLSPKEGVLKQGSPHTFRIRIPGAKSAYLKYEGHSHELKLVAPDLFEANVIFPERGLAIVYALLEGRRPGLVGFRVY